jgi:AcrR family transcriptional regulator
MHIPARILRSHAMDIDLTLRDKTQREVAREERILQDAQYLIARFGAAAITFTNLAIAIKIAPSTMRKHFADFDALLGEIMRRHLRRVLNAIAEVPPGTPDRQRLQRAAYIGATRTLGAFTEAHLILTTYLATLPEDERCSVMDMRAQLGTILAGSDGEATLHLLDCLHYDLDQIEDMLAAAAARRKKPQAPPAMIAEAPPPPACMAVHTLSDISGVALPGGLLMDPAAPRKPPDPAALMSDAALRGTQRAPPGEGLAA